MCNIAILGNGAMGKVLNGMIDDMDDVKCVGIVEPRNGETLMDIEETVDVVIDFSHPDNLIMLEHFAEYRPCPVIIATTGQGQQERDRISAMAERVPVVFAANFSLGIAVMKRILEDISPILKDDFDIELVEKHHNKKLDAPSGTAKLLLKAIDNNEELERVYGREGNRKRGNEIGVHAVRGGTIPGEHAVIFAGEDEILEISHMAGSKKIFARGAIKAALFAVKQPPGLYHMEDVLWKHKI